MSLHADIVESSLQCTMKNRGAGQGTVSLPTADSEDNGLFVGDAKAVDERCIRRCTLVNVADNMNCSSAMSTPADDLVKHITTLSPSTKIDGMRVGDMEEVEKEIAANDWMLVARIIDRICFIVFSLGLIAGTLAVSLMATLGG